VIRYRYNTQVRPAAPFVHLLLRNPANGRELSSVPAQIDTAADRTVLPQALADNLGLAQIGTMLIGGLGGITYTLPTYVLLIGVHDLTAQPVKVVASADETWTLLGRDLLNGIRLTLDGPQSALEIG
jgi:hypothetical protein